MKEPKTKIRKVCGFYTNDWHLTIMILPYIRDEINNNHQTITILQNTIKPNIREILSRMNVNSILKQQILEINWEKTELIKYNTIKNELLKINGQTQNINILVSGNEDFIQKANQNIDNMLERENLKSKVTIINCYDITQNIKMENIKTKYEFTINTAGIYSLPQNNKKTKKEA